MSIVRLIRARFDELGRNLAIKFDLTILTHSEFGERPLREMDNLVPLSTPDVA